MSFLKFLIHETLTVSVNYGVEKMTKSELTMQSKAESKRSNRSLLEDTFDGRNPAPPGMYKTL